MISNQGLVRPCEGHAHGRTFGGRPTPLICARRVKPQRGQATVELALLLPVIMAVALAVVQVGIVSFRQVQVVHAAREVARMVAVTGDASGATEAAARASSLEADRLEVVVDGPLTSGSLVTVTVRYRDPTEVPVVGNAISDVVLQAQITMRVE